LRKGDEKLSYLVSSIEQLLEEVKRFPHKTCKVSVHLSFCCTAIR